MVSSLSTTYFQSYQLAYQLCKQVERCYQFELGVADSSFIQFGYWDSLYKGLLPARRSMPTCGACRRRTCSRTPAATS